MMKICPLCRTNAEISDGSPLEEDNTGREFNVSLFSVRSVEGMIIPKFGMNQKNSTKII